LISLEDFMSNWILVDFLICVAYGVQHTILTTKTAVKIYNYILPAYTWNMVYSIFSVITLGLGFKFWEKSGVTIFNITSENPLFHLFVVSLSLSLFFFFFCFKYTTSFYQWIGVKQIAMRIKNKKSPEYYRVRKEGIKKYIRFPHHTCLIFFFWLHPVMTEDTLLLAIMATAYLYLGTWHQDNRGKSLIGEEWIRYQENTNLLLPGVKVLKRFFSDLKSSRG